MSNLYPHQKTFEQTNAKEQSAEMFHCAPMFVSILLSKTMIPLFYIRSLAEIPHLSSRSHYSCWLEVLPFFIESKSRHLGRTYWNRPHLYSCWKSSQVFPQADACAKGLSVGMMKGDPWVESSGGQDFGGFLG